MKTETGYIYKNPHGQIIVNPDKSPDCAGFDNDAWLWYVEATIQWSANSIPVMNAEKAGYPKRWFIFTNEFYEITDGQKVQHIEGKVIKLL